MQAFTKYCSICFSYFIFGFFGILLNVILTLECLIIRNKTKRVFLARRTVSFFWRGFVYFLSWVRVIDYQLKGFEKLGAPGQIIFPNHPSLLDVVILVSFIPKVNCIVKKDLLKNPILSTAIKSCAYIVNDESVQVLDKVQECFEKGESLIVFPEGTRTPDDNQVTLQRAAVSLGLRGAQSIAPVIIKQNPRHFKKSQKWFKVPKVRVKYQVSAAPIINPQDYLAAHHVPVASRNLTQYLQNLFNRETNHHE